jgi:hypothetical protein
MKWQHTDRSKADYDNLQPNIQKAFDKQVRLLAANLLHPSLRAKKYDESQDLWQAGSTRAGGSFSFIVDDTYIIARIVPHPK